MSRSILATSCNRRYLNSVFSAGANAQWPSRAGNSSVCDLDAWMKSDPNCQGDKHVEAEFFPLATHQVGHARLTNTENFGRLCLRPSVSVNRLSQRSHKVSPQLQQSRLFGRKSEIGEYVAARFRDVFFHDLAPNLLVATLREFDVCFGRLLCLLLEGVQDEHGISELRHVDHAPLALDVNPNFICAWPYGHHWFEVRGHQASLYHVQFETGVPAGFCGKISQVVQGRTDKTKCFHGVIIQVLLYSRGRVPELGVPETSTSQDEFNDGRGKDYYDVIVLRAMKASSVSEFHGGAR